MKKQAERWAKRKADFLHRPKAFVSIYEFDSESADIKDFDNDLNSWFDFVCDCRNGDEKYRTFEIIKGKVANDKVYRVVEFYNNGIWDKARVLEEIKIYDIYDQIAFISQKALDKLLHFQKFYEVSL